MRWGRYAQTEVVTGVLIPADGQRACYRDVNEERIEQIARLIGLQRQRIAAQEQLHRQEVQALDTAIDNAQRQIRLAQAQRTQQNRDIALLQRQWSDQQALLSRARAVVEPLAEVYDQAAYVRAA